VRGQATLPDDATRTAPSAYRIVVVRRATASGEFPDARLPTPDKAGTTMGYILLGHGDLNVDPKVTDPDMEFVAIPKGTTIQFYADAGQGLAYGSRALDLWEQLAAPWPALDSSRVTYNLSLYNARALWDAELQNNPQFGGHVLVRAGVDGYADPLRMCTGTRKTCPTDPRDVAAGAVHTCDGILGTLKGDLYWLACTSFRNLDADLEAAALGDMPTSEYLNLDPSWVPDEDSAEVIADVNRENLEDLDEGDSVSFAVGGFVLLIGDGHEGPFQRYVYGQSDLVEGKVTLEGEDWLEFEDVPPAKQGVVESAVARCSTREATFR
jgi:hypothetical protein